jgi:hypothetical protein
MKRPVADSLNAIAVPESVLQEPVDFAGLSYDMTFCMQRRIVHPACKMISDRQDAQDLCVQCASIAMPGGELADGLCNARQGT